PDPSGLIINKWPGNRQYLVTDAAGYAGTFFDTSLSIVSLTFFCFVVIISAVSFLIVASIVAFPVHQQSGELRILRAIGASGNQIATALALQFAVLGHFHCRARNCQFSGYTPYSQF
ncbi:MAG: FtsX-like permease family protein, partial [Candidatus Hodarchaeales archaeon]